MSVDASPPAPVQPVDRPPAEREQHLAWLPVVELAVVLLLMLGFSALLYALLGVLCCGR